MEKQKTIIVIFLMCSFFLTSFSYAEGPSKEESFNFLKKKLEITTKVFDLGDSKREITIQGCTLISFTYYLDEGRMTGEKTTIPLRKLDPNRIEVIEDQRKKGTPIDRGLVVLHTTDDVDAIEIENSVPSFKRSRDFVQFST